VRNEPRSAGADRVNGGGESKRDDDPFVRSLYNKLPGANQQKLLEWFNYNKYYDNDQQQGRNFIENAKKPDIPHPLVAGKPLEIAFKRTVIQKEEQNRRQLSKNPELQKLKLACNE
jgi:hypothetical protein